MANYSNGESSSDQEVERGIVPKVEVSDLELPSETMYLRNIGVCFHVVDYRFCHALSYVLNF